MCEQRTQLLGECALKFLALNSRSFPDETMTQAWVQPLVYSLDSPILKKIEDVFDGIFICTGKVSLIHNNYSKKKPSSNVLNVTKDMF